MIEEKSSHLRRIGLREEKLVTREWEAQIVFNGKTYFSQFNPYYIWL